jgi:hypothetical protein
MAAHLRDVLPMHRNYRARGRFAAKPQCAQRCGRVPLDRAVRLAIARGGEVTAISLEKQRRVPVLPHPVLVVVEQGIT